MSIYRQIKPYSRIALCLGGPLDTLQVPDWSVSTEVVCSGAGCIFYEHESARIDPLEHGPVNASLWVEHSPSSVVIWRDAPGLGLMWYAQSGSRIVCSNDMIWLCKQLECITPNATRLARVSAGLDPYDQTTEGYIQGVHRIRPGHKLMMWRNGTCEQYDWWREKVQLYQGIDPEGEQFIERLDDALLLTHRQGRAGLAVSSGLDSTLLAARAQALGLNLEWGSMSFPHTPESDETALTMQWSSMFQKDVCFVDMTASLLWPEDCAMTGWSTGVQIHPGESYERRFIRAFVEQQDLRWIYTGVGADQLFDVQPVEVFREYVQHGEWAKITQGRRRTDVFRLVRLVYGSALWRSLMPDTLRRSRLHSQLVECAQPLLSEVHLDELVEGLLEVGEHSVLQRMLSWSWENLMRSLWRLNQSARACGAELVTPYLDESLWLWRAQLSASVCMNRYHGTLYNKFKLRQSHHQLHHDQFPEGFAWRGKAAVFDAHISKAMCGEDRMTLEGLIHGMDEELRAPSWQRWEKVKDGMLGRDLVELYRLCAVQKWKQTVRSQNDSE
mgnify:CR=1 FL=1